MTHAFSSVKTFGGSFKDYIDIHNFMDDSKSVFADNRHRALTHNSWFVNHVIEKVFGVFITNTDGKNVSTKAIAEQHILEDFGGKFIPTAQDYLQEIDYKPWMNGNGFPASRLKIEEKTNSKFIPFSND